MAILNATAMERDRVNLGWSMPVQKCQQIVETVAARHRSTLHYCLSRYGIFLNRSSPPQMSLRHLSPCGLVPIARRGRSAPLTPMRSTRTWPSGSGSGQRWLAPESDSRLRVFINSASHAGFPNERGKEALALSGTLKAGASEFGLMQEALYRRTGGDGG